MTLETVIEKIKLFSFIKLIIDDIVYFDDTETWYNTDEADKIFKKQKWCYPLNRLKEIEMKKIVDHIDIQIVEDHHSIINIKTQKI